MTRKALLTQPVHRWFTFPHSFTRELVHALIDEWQLTSRDLILDPFVGAGTTLLAAKERHVAANGYDLSPLSALASRVKIANYKRSALRSLTRALRAKLTNLRHSEHPSGDYPALLLKALPGDLLRTLCACAAAIDELACSRAEREFFKLAMIAILPAFSRAKATGGWLKWVNTDSTASTVSVVLADQIETMIADVSSRTSTPPSASWRVGVADARSIPDADNTYTAVISSPPYPNRHDYTRIFAVELLFGFLTTEQLRRLRHTSLRSHPEARPTAPRTYGYTRPPQLDTLISRLEQSGSDMRIPRMLDGYFLDIHRCLEEAYRVCKPGAKLAYVLGNVRYSGQSVPVDELTAQLGENVGLTCNRISVTRHRGNSAQQMGRYGRRPSRESVVFFERS